MTFDSLDQIRKEFGINESDPEIVRKELVGRLADLHPDRNDGTSASPDDQNRWGLIQEAIKFVDRSKEQRMVPFDQVSDLVKSVTDLAEIKNQESPQDRLSNQVSEKERKLDSYATTPRITSAAITTLMTVVWAFPGITEDHPILSQYVDLSSPFFTTIWLATILSTLQLWIIASMIERREKSFLRALKSERAQGDLFGQFVGTCLNERGDHDLAFSKGELIDFIMRQIRLSTRSRTSPLLRLFGRTHLVDLELAETLADSILGRAKKKKLITDDESRSLDSKYKFAIDPESVAKPQDDSLFHRYA